MGKKMNAIDDWIEDSLRRMCGRITPGKRLAVILTMFLGFTALSLYFTISSIYRFGKGDGERVQIQHIQRLELELQRKESQLDSIKHVNNFNYEYRESE